MCHRASDKLAWHCACGYEFGQDVARTRELLRSQLTNARIALGIFGTLELAIAVGTWFAVQYGFVITPIASLVGSTVIVARSLRKISISRESLKLLAPKDLPVARALR
jgi:hypothetical protein